jgi:hypothetical protein
MLNFGGNIYRERKKPVGRLRCELDSAGWGYSHVLLWTGPKYPASIKGGEFAEQMRDCQLLKKRSAAHSRPHNCSVTYKALSTAKLLHPPSVRGLSAPLYCLTLGTGHKVKCLPPAVLSRLSEFWKAERTMKSEEWQTLRTILYWLHNHPHCC